MSNKQKRAIKIYVQKLLRQDRIKIECRQDRGHCKNYFLVSNLTSQVLEYLHKYIIGLKDSINSILEVRTN